ncbi:hypothetical protein BpHYR1_028107 [Brachionus plicatilis]|uniref:Uncharacterized protein n=1 Tax=Brachionus plicatilis TaxID=10195 RepID=A0A3M7R955_BRAPC|nr:hypothetical protein BpHYR1_028107 [Brachionus plicatilis]
MCRARLSAYELRVESCRFVIAHNYRLCLRAVAAAGCIVPAERIKFAIEIGISVILEDLAACVLNLKVNGVISSRGNASRLD